MASLTKQNTLKLQPQTGNVCFLEIGSTLELVTLNNQLPTPNLRAGIYKLILPEFKDLSTGHQSSG